ncbi:hypothetical protein GCM10027440_17020 [Nocardiopsis coralliicola]
MCRASKRMAAPWGRKWGRHGRPYARRLRGFGTAAVLARQTRPALRPLHRAAARRSGRAEVSAGGLRVAA